MVHSRTSVKHSSGMQDVKKNTHFGAVTGKSVLFDTLKPEYNILFRCTFNLKSGL